MKIEFPCTKARRLKKESEETQRLSLISMKQMEIGLSIAEIVEMAARKNNVYDICNGERMNGYGPIAVKILRKNGDRFSILTTLQDPSVSCMTFGIRDLPMHQIDINLSKIGKEIHIFNGPYGPESWCDISELEQTKALIARGVREYCLFSNRPIAI